MNDDLEVFVASGLDIPTAIVASEKPGPGRRKGCSVIVIIAVVLAILSLLWQFR